MFFSTEFLIDPERARVISSQSKSTAATQTRHRNTGDEEETTRQDQRKIAGRHDHDKQQCATEGLTSAFRLRKGVNGSWMIPPGSNEGLQC